MTASLPFRAPSADLAARAEFCRDLVRSAGVLAREGFVRRLGSQIGLKGPQDFLTETDALVEHHPEAKYFNAT